jgi:membrane-associated phospholipid phosphatase
MRATRREQGTRAVAALLAAMLALPAPAPAQDAPPPPAAPDAPAATPAPSPSPAPEPARKTGRGANDQRRTIRSYPQNLFYNTLGVVTRGNHAPLAAGFALVPAAMLLDDEWISYFDRNPQPGFADFGATLGGTIVVSGLTVGFFSAGRIARGGRFRATTYDVSQTILINAIYTFGLKYAIRRQRPDGGDRLSFPSGHTSNAVAGATVIYRHYGYKLGIPGYGLAALIGVSRMAGNRHHFSDVIGGAVLGFGVGRAVVRRNSRPPTPPGGPTPPVPDDPSVALLPDGGPSGDGVGLSLSIRF